VVRKLGEVIGTVISIALSIPAVLLTLVLFYGIVLLIFEYVFGVTLWNPFRGGGVGMGG
jgi:hypothetical protein